MKVQFEMHDLKCMQMHWWNFMFFKCVSYLQVFLWPQQHVTTFQLQMVLSESVNRYWQYLYINCPLSVWCHAGIFFPAEVSLRSQRIWANQGHRKRVLGRHFGICGFLTTNQANFYVTGVTLGANTAPRGLKTTLWGLSGSKTSDSLVSGL